MTILLVDDDPGTLNALKIGLISHGFNVVAAGSGADALEIIRESAARNVPVRLLISDFRMPGMDGLQLIRAAKAMVPDLATVLITGYGSEGLREDTEWAGVSGYLEKPFTPDVLIREIEALRENGSGGVLIGSEERACARRK
ncbi:MAG: response regulator [Deltaproteobacteria bacterium]|nr:response regulator [Deltaproteobacteria bacterium]